MMKGQSTQNNQVKYEVADIFHRYGAEYRRNNGLTRKQHYVMNAVERCRTSWYGYHQDKCDQCGYVEIDYNSCRDRHCPKCQGVSRTKWVNARLDDILPVPYYHVVFTLPHLLHDLTSHNKKLIYDLLFSCASQTLLTFGQDPKWLGGEIGFYGILHTWGQKLWQHPHLHFIVPGGAITKNNSWVAPQHRSKFLFPVHALSKVFRGKFIEGLKEAHSTAKLTFSTETRQLESVGGFEQWINRLVARNWVVYCKRPFGDAEQVVRYIGRYTHRVAISNNRIIDVQDGQVRFNYKDYKACKKSWKIMQLNAQEFIRRFLLHVLPDGFHKIRHYGFLANGRRKTKVQLIKHLLQIKPDKEKKELTDDWRMGCPKCETGRLFPYMIVTRFFSIMSSLAMCCERGYGKCSFDTS
ncbi:MAG: IS91 family transposase [Deltaproteobacteria bacterium]|nr:IS91 family transposase [Deltaproteobacteria bacterium]